MDRKNKNQMDNGKKKRREKIGMLVIDIKKKICNKYRIRKEEKIGMLATDIEKMTLKTIKRNKEERTGMQVIDISNKSKITKSFLIFLSKIFKFHQKELNKVKRRTHKTA
jgi:hypothetical protein